MTRTILLNIFCLLIVSLSYGQNKVKTLSGRGVYGGKYIVYDGSYNGYKKFPIDANRREIQILILDDNNIEKLPLWISNLPNLRVLSLRNNNLKEIDPIITSCTKLEVLLLSGNPNLTDLPVLWSCENLRLINVVGTGIHDAPNYVPMMKKLRYFRYSKKPKKRK
ncbi:leucine-rich repeat domain-containing protein [Halosquirtibacter xylanolyticus]|uniref:leucine-rich repeat domain-containing protein n=1 Tax=Halosquirtibacter xylanolyticus TaxID=3374599 RepID=UPI0037498D45|nr:leucine-rich repeat domain-containing protein [Prolixibacteraceae bacterium]